MPKGSQSSMMAEWSALLKVVRENEAELGGGVRCFQEALERSHTEAAGAKGRRDALYASTLEETRTLNRALAEGRDAAIALRSFIRGVLGVRTEKLRRYGIKPLRRRARRMAKLAVRCPPES